MPLPKRIIAHRGKSARRLARARLGRLADRLVQPRTQIRYESMVLSFFLFVRATYATPPLTPFALDLAASNFIEMLWQEGDPLQYVKDFLCGLSHAMPLKAGTLHMSWKLHNAWQKTEAPVRCLPLLESQLLGLVGYLLSKNEVKLGALLALAFYTFLRTMEFLTLRRGDLTWDCRTMRGLVRLRLSKTGKRLGVDEGLVINDPLVVALLQLAFADLSSDQLLTDMPEPAFRARFTRLISKFGLDAADIKPYSLRRGGATWHFRCYLDMNYTCLIGRWASHRTAKIYIQDALAQLAAGRQTPLQEKTFAHYAKVASALIA
jgi:hypothetical protein